MKCSQLHSLLALHCLHVYRLSAPEALPYTFNSTFLTIDYLNLPMFYNDAKKKALEILKKHENEYKELGTQANDYALKLFETRKAAVQAIRRVESYVNALANSPKEFAKQISEVKLSIKDFNEAVEIEKRNASNNIKGAGAAITGTATGGAIAALGPTAAMAIATTFGTASTGTAIASLSGAAATNAALAWLGGGALAVGGGGMSAGSAFLALAGPVGWSLGVATILGGVFFASHKNKQAAQQADEASKEILTAICNLRPQLERLIQLHKKTERLKRGLNISFMVNTFPKDYLLFSEEQKKTLATTINNVRAMGQLINQRIH